MVNYNPLTTDFFLQPTLKVARNLLGKILVRRFDDETIATGRIVETEAYTVDDPACHAYRGPTKRNQSMFGPPGHAYVYLNYGIHYCLNAVCAPEGTAEAVLIRGVEPLENAARLWANYVGSEPLDDSVLRDKRLGAGPGRLTRAFAIGPEMDGSDLTDSSGAIYFAQGAFVPEDEIVATTRIGITRGVELPWRFYVAKSPFVSKR